MRSEFFVFLPLGVALAADPPKNSTTPASSKAALASTPSISTITWTSCSSSGGPTSTGITTITEPCEMCESESSAVAAATGTPENRIGSTHFTSWTTAWTIPCPEASSNEYRTAYTATITESCTGATPTWASTGAKNVPSGWTSAMVTCTACGSTPISTIATFPASASLPSGVQGPPAAPATPSSAARSGSPAPSAAHASPAAGSPAAESPAVAVPSSSSKCTKCTEGAGGSSETPAPGTPAPAAGGSPAASPAPSSPKAKHTSSASCAAGSMAGACLTAQTATMQVSQKPASTAARVASTPESCPGCGAGGGAGGSATHAWYKGAGVRRGPGGVVAGLVAMVGVVGLL